MKLTNLNNNPIVTLEDWLNGSPPAQGEKHWKDGRSAKELAKAWISDQGPKVPTQMLDLLDSHDATRHFQPQWAIPEFVTTLDNFRGNGRNHDMILVGEAGGKKTLIAVEAKSDEAFGDTIANYVSKSVIRNRLSNVPHRVKHLSAAIFGARDVGHLRCQLLHAIGGTLIEANNQHAEQAILVVHEFVQGSTPSKKAEQNEEDLQAVTQLLFETKLLHGQLLGPLYIPGGQFVPHHIPLFIGKIQTVIALPTSNIH